MLLNYFKIAFRNLLKSKGFSVINITGLSIGMASAILIILWINHEVQYDQFHEKKDRIYEAWNRSTFSNKLQSWNTTPKILAKAMQQDLPEVEKTARVNWQDNYLLTVGEKSVAIDGNVVDSTFLDVFSFPLSKGNVATALQDPHSMVITEKLALNLFGDENPMGKIVKLNNSENFTVTGVARDLPDNSRFKFEFLIPWAYQRTIGNDDENWGNNSTRTYVLLKQNASFDAAQQKMKGMRKKYDPSEPEGEMFLYPISRWRLYSSFENGVESGGLIEFVRIFCSIAFFILLIACINFMNLSTARSEKRAKEVGIRKVVGAQKGNLIAQFLGESVLIALIAGLLSLMIVQLSLPAFNNLTRKHLIVDYSSMSFWLAFLSFVVLTGVIAGSYPAFYLSSFRPTSVLKGTFRKIRALVTPRKVLVVVQFSFAIILIMSTIVVRKQLKHAQDRQTGYEKDNLGYHFLTGDLEKNYLLVKQELLASGIASSVSKTSAPLTEGWSDSWGFEWAGKAPGDKTDFDRFCVDESLAKTAGLQLVKGRDFDLQQFPTDSLAILLNESAAKAMGFKDPIGQLIRDNGKEWHVVGVFRDFILHSPFYPTRPMVVEGAKGWFNVIHMKLNGNNGMAANLKNMEQIFKKYNPAYPFDFKFVDEEYANKFEDEKRIATLSGLFAALTIFISCLGLFGLATYMTSTRVKEIGVRKVLGASVGSITSLLSKDFIKLVAVSFVIAAPIAWYAMSKWLDDYPYRTALEWWLFAIAGLLALMIALVTVSFQAIKAAIANPVHSLRSE